MDKLKHRQVWADVLLLLVTLVWGSTFVMVKDAVAAYPVFPFLTLRFGLATLALLAVGWRRLGSLGWKGWGAGALIRPWTSKNNRGITTFSFLQEGSASNGEIILLKTDSVTIPMVVCPYPMVR